MGTVGFSLRLGRLVCGLSLALNLAEAKTKDVKAAHQIELIDYPFFKDCFGNPGTSLKKSPLTIEPDESLADILDSPLPTPRWFLKCSIEKFLKEASKVSVISPALRMLVGRSIHFEILKTRAEALLTYQTLPKTVMSLSPAKRTVNFASLETLGLRDFPIELETFESPQNLVLSQTDGIVLEAKKWLEPLFDSPILRTEAGLLYFEILGDSFRFPSAEEWLRAQSFSQQPRWARSEVIYKVTNWVEAFNASLLKPWLLKKLIDQRPTEIVSSRREDFFSWTKSLELDERPGTTERRDFILGKLRELSIAYPAPSDQKRIQSIADRFLLKKHYKPTPMTGMTAKGLLVHAQALIKNVHSIEALKALDLIASGHRKCADVDELWSAFQLHVRILRILDQREKIPKVMDRYLRKKNFLNLYSRSPTLSKDIDRAIDVAKLYWTYDDPQKALSSLETILRFSRRFKNEQARSQALYVKARIHEQATSKEEALKSVEEALQTSLMPPELQLDLKWRRILIHFDLAAAKNDYKSLPALFEGFKVPSNDPIEKGKFYFWQARALDLSGDLAKAKHFYRQAYDSDMFSYYSNLSGLELKRLGESLADWKVAAPGPISEPNWKEFFSESGELKDPAYAELARVYFLAKIADNAAASRAFSDVDRVLWARVLSSQVPDPERLAYARAVAWIRLALGDNMGSLRAAEVARQALARQLQPLDYFYLYPLPFWSEIEKNANANTINPWIVASLIRQESAFNPKARSGANAIGLMQMIPPVAEEEAALMKVKKFQIDDLYNPATAIKLGTHHLKRNLTKFDESWICAIAAYNAGSPPVKRWQGYYPNTSPLAFIERISYTETRNYVKSILRNFVNYQRIFSSGEVNQEMLFRMPKPISDTASLR